MSAAYELITMLDATLPADKEDGSKTPTNADRIRSMTDEELEENLLSGLCYMIPSDYCKRFDLCADCVRAWLKEEVTTNG